MVPAGGSSWKPVYKTLSDITVMIEDMWDTEDGRSVKIILGKPTPFTDAQTGNSYFACPFFVEGFTAEIVTAVSEGPLSAMMSACVAIRRIFDYPEW
jgi:hypothetical protein